MDLKTKYTPIAEDHTKVTKTFETNNWVFRFDNKYGASVVCHLNAGRVSSYGSKNKPFELAVVKFYDNHLGYQIDFGTPIADDVIGYLSEKEVEEILERIEKL